MHLMRWPCFRAFHKSASEYFLKGSRLLLKVPEKITGSCGMMVSLDLRVCRPRPAISTLSIKTFPSAASTILKKASVRDDFPAPVRPTTPIFSPPETLKFSPLRTRSSPSLYRIFKSQTSMLPFNGHSSLGSFSGLVHSAS